MDIYPPYDNPQKLRSQTAQVIREKEISVKQKFLDSLADSLAELPTKIQAAIDAGNYSCEVHTLRSFSEKNGKHWWFFRPRTPTPEWEMLQRLKEKLELTGFITNLQYSCCNEWVEKQEIVASDSSHLLINPLEYTTTPSSARVDIYRWILSTSWAPKDDPKGTEIQ